MLPGRSKPLESSALSPGENVERGRDQGGRQNEGPDEQIVPARQRTNSAAENGAIAAPMPTLETIRPSAAPRSPGGEYLVTETLASAGMAAPASALHDPPKDERTEARRPRTDEAPRSERNETYHESAADAEYVRSAPVERDAHGVGQQVAGDHPPDLSL